VLITANTHVKFMHSQCQGQSCSLQSTTVQVSLTFYAWPYTCFCFNFKSQINIFADMQVTATCSMYVTHINSNHQHVDMSRFCTRLAGACAWFKTAIEVTWQHVVKLEERSTVAQATKFWPKMCGSSVWNLLHVTIPALKILRSVLNVWKNVASLS
jgi:hypothetical protein